MHETALDNYAPIADYMVKDAYHPGPLMRGAWTTPSDSENWVKEYMEPIRVLQKSLEELEGELSNERRVEVKRSDEVILFCADRSLVRYLGLFEELVRKCFPTAQKIVFSIEYDPETTEKWINADVQILGEIDQIIEWEDNFVSEWVDLVPYPELEKIRLSCDIL